jgi:hypothetical protein
MCVGRDSLNCQYQVIIRFNNFREQVIQRSQRNHTDDITYKMWQQAAVRAADCGGGDAVACDKLTRQAGWTAAECLLRTAGIQLPVSMKRPVTATRVDGRVDTPRPSPGHRRQLMPNVVPSRWRRQNETTRGSFTAVKNAVISMLPSLPFAPGQSSDVRPQKL